MYLKREIFQKVCQKNTVASHEAAFPALIFNLNLASIKTFSCTLFWPNILPTFFVIIGFNNSIRTICGSVKETQFKVV